MNDQDAFDPWVAARFERERRDVPADAFVTATMQKIRAARRRKEATRLGLRVAVLIAAIVGSPWLIDGAARLSEALESSYTWTFGLSGMWILGVLAILVVIATRVRGR